ncbi:hypothetical protein D3C80_1880850 [compost metagenome]
MAVYNSITLVLFIETSVEGIPVYIRQFRYKWKLRISCCTLILKCTVSQIIHTGFEVLGIEAKLLERLLDSKRLVQFADRINQAIYAFLCRACRQSQNASDLCITLIRYEA